MSIGVVGRLGGCRLDGANGANVFSILGKILSCGSKPIRSMAPKLFTPVNLLNKKSTINVLRLYVNISNIPKNYKDDMA